jgi:ABC-type dipeptide/oligopeptide/nickel transport system permease subunit
MHPLIMNNVTLQFTHVMMKKSILPYFGVFLQKVFTTLGRAENSIHSYNGTKVPFHSSCNYCPHCAGAINIHSFIH